jgi:hypothetical protein
LVRDMGGVLLHLTADFELPDAKPANTVEPLRGARECLSSSTFIA